MTNANDTSQLNDWNKLARDALDLWEGHLNALASDPKAKEDLAKFISPMSGMFEQWSDMMQKGLQGTSPFTASTPSSTPSSDSPKTADSSETTGVAEEPSEYTVWQEEMIKAAQAAAAATAATFAVAPSAPCAVAPVETEARGSDDRETQTMEAHMNAAYAALVDVSDAAMPAYGSHTGASFAALQEAMPDYYKTLIHPGSDSVADAYKQEVAADAKPDVLVPAATTTSGGSFVAAGPRDLAQLASRLAQLERELDGMRSKNNAGGADASLDDSDDGDAQRMARARQGTSTF